MTEKRMFLIASGILCVLGLVAFISGWIQTRADLVQGGGAVSAASLVAIATGIGLITWADERRRVRVEKQQSVSVVKSFGPTVFMNFGPGKSGCRSHLGHPVTVVCCRGFVCSGSEPAAGSVDDHFLGPGCRAGARDLWSPSRCLFGCSRRA